MSKRDEFGQVATQIPFDNTSNSFDAEDTQSAIEEARDAAAGFPRAGLALIYNGTVSNNDLISYSNLTPQTPIVFPVNTQLNEVTFANSKTNVSCNIQIWKDGAVSGTLIKTLNISTGTSNSAVFDLNLDLLTFNAGQFLQIVYIDLGTNASDMALVLWISRIP